MSPNRKSWNLVAAGVTVLVLCSSPSFAGPPRGGLRYTVVVDKFENKSEGPRALGNEWATLLTSALQENGQFIVVAQSDMQLKALNEQIRGLSGTTAQGRKTAKRGQMAPAQLLVKGVITHFKQGAASQGGGFGVGKMRLNAGRKKTEIRGSLQMIDATTGVLVAAKNFIGIAQNREFKASGEDKKRDGNINMAEDDNVHAALEKAISEVIPWLVAQLPSVSWRGSVVKVDGEQVIINRGLREGVKSADEFVLGESELLRDPDTGELLDEVIHERARIRVVQLAERTSTCSVVKGDVGQIVVGMAIQYSRERK